MQGRKSSIFNRFWVYGLSAGLFLVVFAAYPQLKLWNSDSGGWHGHYAYNDIDEVAYASYLKALIDGRPRKNDPYTGRDEAPGAPQPESLFSIQFAAPYAVALPARVIGLSAPAAMMIAGVVAGFLAAFLCFLLIREISGNDLLAFSGTLFVLCGGALFAGEGAIGEILGTGFPYPYFPFLRRYVPAVPFPLFFLLLLSTWKLLNSEGNKLRIIWIIVSLFSFSFLVFSYFYLWTTAMAWLFILGLAILVVRPEKWKRHIASLLLLGGTCLIPLFLYAYLLSQRAVAMDNVQLLVRTRALDFDRVPLVLGLVSVAAAILLVLTRLARQKSLVFIFTLVTAIVPLVLFNQQTVTGISLQPIHYQVFIGNYVAGLSLVFAICLAIERTSEQNHAVVKIGIAAVGLASIIWGFVECHYTVRVLDAANVARDRAYDVGNLLAEKGRASGDPYRDTVLSFSNLHADDSPTIAPQNVLWSRHQHVFAGLNWEESKKRFYLQLYYRDLGPDWLDKQLRSGNFVAMIALFGWGRHTDRLSSEARPLTFHEINEEVKKFRKFYEGFDARNSLEPELDFLVVPDASEQRLENLTRWYDLALIGNTGGHRVYNLTPKKTKN